MQSFHTQFRVPQPTFPQIPSNNRIELRLTLIQEELSELFDAVEKDDLTEIADALVDSIAVIIGMAIEFGIDLRPLWDEVHKTNMLKVGGPTREDGKILKPEGWQAPKIQSLLRAQGASI